MSTTFNTIFRRFSPAFATAAALSAAIGVGFAASPVGATSEPTWPDVEVQLLDPGDPSRPVDLLAMPDVGSTARTTKESVQTGTVSVDGDEPRSGEIDVHMTTEWTDEVVAADEAGVTVRRRVESYDDDDHTDVGQSERPPAADLVGTDIDHTYDPQRALVAAEPAPGVELTPVEQDALDRLIADGGGTVRFPAEPVGVGAQWTLRWSNAFWVTDATFTLTSLTDGEYTIDFTAEGTADGQLPEAIESATGTLSGSGRIIGNVDDPQRYTIESTVVSDLVVVGYGQETSIATTSTDSTTSTPT